MTLGDIETNIAVDLELNAGTRAGDDPFYLRKKVTDATDFISEETYCLFGAQTREMTSGYSNYCLPDFFRIDSVLVKDSAGDWRNLYLFEDKAQADAHLGTQWRTADSADPPGAAIFSTVNDVFLYPTPSVTRTGGVKFEGYYKPGQTWLYTTGVAQTLSTAHTCPLPSWAHQAVEWEAKAQIALTDRRPAVQAQAEAIAERAFHLRGNVEQRRAEYTQRSGNKLRNPRDYRK
jgi:hypothetical protein